MNKIINCNVYVVYEGKQKAYLVIEKEGVRMDYSQRLEKIEHFGYLASTIILDKIREDGSGWETIFNLEPRDKTIAQGDERYRYVKLTPAQQDLFWKGFQST